MADMGYLNLDIDQFTCAWTETRILDHINISELL